MKIELPEMVSRSALTSLNTDSPVAVAMDLESDIPHDMAAKRSSEFSSESSNKTLSNNPAKALFSRKQLIISAVAGLMILIIGGLLAARWITGAHSTSTPAVIPPVVTVSIAPTGKVPLDETFSVTGSVSAWDPLSVGAEVSGLRIDSVRVEEGDQVHRGQVLATLNSSVLRAQLAQTRAKLASSEANLKKAIQPNRTEDILGLKAALAQAQAAIAQEEAHLTQTKGNLAEAAHNAVRYAQLAPLGAVSMQDAENRKTIAATAEEEVRSAEAKLQAAKFTAEQALERELMATRGGRSEDIDISRATIAEMKATIDQLNAQIEQTVIRAPEDGLITKRDAHIGDIPSAGKPLFFIIRANRLELRAQVSDIDLGKFKNGQMATVKTTEQEPRTVSGTVWLVSPQVDPTTRLGTVRIDLPPDAGLKPGMFVQAEVNLGRRTVLMVPLSALVAHNGQSFVYIIDSGERVHAKPVKVGTRTDETAELVSGIESGQNVVVQGAGFLADGDKVHVAR